MNGLRQFGRKAVGGLALVGALAGLMMFVVLPALASTPGQAVPPASSPGGVTPIDVQTGGQDNDCSLFYPSGSTLHAFYVDNPKSKSYTDPATGATFTITTNPTPSTGWPAYANGKYMSFRSTGAAIVDVGVNGGNDTTHYGYAKNGFTTADGYLHAAAQSVDSSGNPTQLYSIGHVAFCYGLTATAGGTVFTDMNTNTVRDTGEAGLSGVTVNVYSGATLAGSAVTKGDGSYQLTNLAPGSTYTVCVVAKDATETLPSSTTASKAACSGTDERPLGYSFTTSQTVTGLDFGIAPGTVSGTVFTDANQNGCYDVAGGASCPPAPVVGTDSALGGWTVTLYGGSSPLSTTSKSDGSYSIPVSFSPGTAYTVCETPPSGLWGQTAPPAATCSSGQGLPDGYTVTPTSSWQTVTGRDFGNMQASACQNGTAFGGSDPNNVVQLGTCNGKTGGFVIATGTTTTGKPFTSVSPGAGSASTLTPMVEKIVWPYPLTSGQNQVTVEYTDVVPFSLGNLRPMQFCRLDPRDLGVSDTALLSTYQIDANKNQVLPPPSTADPNPTSCLVATTDAAQPSGSNPPGTITVYVFTDVDPMNVGA